MKRLIICFILFIPIIGCYAQNRFQGYVYTYQNARKDNFQYTVTTKEDDGVYKTIYKLYSPITGKNRFTVIASHLKSEKRIIVEVHDEQYLLGVMNNNEEISYTELSLNIFGIRGNVGVFDKEAPNQLAVQFVSNRFDFLRVSSFLGSTEDGIFQYIIFNKYDKVTEVGNSHSESVEIKDVKIRRNLTEPGKILNYTYKKLIDSLNKNGIEFKRDTALAEDEFIGYYITTNTGQYFVHINYLVGSYQFQVPVTFNDVFRYYQTKGAKVIKCEQSYSTLSYGIYNIEINEMIGGKCNVVFEFR